MSVGQSVLRIPVEPPEIQEITIAPEVAVVGDHPVCVAMADALSTMGLAVTLIHPYESLEGLMDPLRVLVEVDESVAEKYASLTKDLTRPSIKVVGRATVEGIEGQWGDFRLSVLKDASRMEVKASGIAMAFQGISKLPDAYDGMDVIGLSQFFSQLDIHKGCYGQKSESIRKIAFVLDVEQRDEKWASATAFTLGRYLKENFGTEVYILCQDVKVSLDGMEKGYRRAREAGILVFKYEDLPVVEGTAGSWTIRFRDSSAVSKESPWEIALEGLDVVVVQERLRPSENQRNLLTQLRISSEGGFVGPNNPQFLGRTSKKGVVVGGDTWYPEYPTEGWMTAQAAAEELYQWVGKGSYQIDVHRVAEVDPSKCATCLTCYRICPHDSIRIERYGMRNVYITTGAREGGTWEAARVKVATCDGCGLCASECPAKAIQLIYYPDVEVLEFLEKNV